MEMLNHVIDQMWEELDDAKKYAKCAIKHKTENNFAFEKYIELANEEMAHFNKLHEMATRLIEEEKAKGVELTTEEKAIYNYEHKKAIEKANEIKIMIEMVRK